jgi:hypothetical protein
MYSGLLKEIELNEYNLTELVRFLSKKYYKKLLSDKKTNDSAIINCERTFKYMRKSYICDEALYITNNKLLFYLTKNEYSDVEYVFEIPPKLLEHYLVDYIRSRKIKNLIN